MKTSPSSLSLLDKGVKMGIINIWRNKVLSLATIFVIGVIIFIFNIILAINFTTEDALQALSEKIDITIYLKESTDFSESQDLIEKISQREGIKNVTYTSKDEALTQIKTTHPDLSLAFEKYNLGNPLPASINITTTHPKYHQTISEYLSQEEFKPYLSNIITNESEENNIISSVSKNLIKVSEFTQKIIFWLILTFIIGGTLIILNAIQITIYSRKKEISIMKLVGAPYWFIRFPFIVESAIYGILAVIISFIMLFILSQKIQISDSGGLLPYSSDYRFLLIFIIELIAAIILSITSSLIAVYEHLKQTT